MRYGQALFGWQEVGFRSLVALATITHVGAVILPSTALANQAYSTPGDRRAGDG